MDVVKQVMLNYPQKIKKISLLSDKGKKAVWSIVADSAEYILKMVPINEGRLKFMSHAINYLKSNGIRTPGVVKTSKEADYVMLNGHYFVLFEAIRGKKPKYNKKKELEKIISGLAEFHKASIGIDIPEDTQPSFLLGEWKKEFQKRYSLLENWKRKRSKDHNKNEFDEYFLLHVDSFLNQCKESILIIEESGYQQWVEETKKVKTLCHQDFAAGNLLLDKNGDLNIFDMDSLTIDLPIRDMRKILNKVMKKETKWNVKLMVKMVQHYQKVNPLTKDQYAVLRADLLFPHLFYGQVSKYYGRNEKEWTEEKHVRRLKNMIKTELSKEETLIMFQAQLDDVVH